MVKICRIKQNSFCECKSKTVGKTASHSDGKLATNRIANGKANKNLTTRVTYIHTYIITNLFYKEVRILAALQADVDLPFKEIQIKL